MLKTALYVRLEAKPGFLMRRVAKRIYLARLQLR
jgi:hypothetical protein